MASLALLGSASPSASNDYGSWCFLTSSNEIIVFQGNIFYTDEMSRLPIDGIGKPISIKEIRYIILQVEIQGGYPKSASLLPSEILPPYRTFTGSSKSIQSQTSLSVPVFVIGGGPGGYYNESTGQTIHKCLHTDLMIYANCDGLVFLPAPYSLPQWAAPAASAPDQNQNIEGGGEGGGGS